jgi:uncharacterized protein (DUF697 family)
MSVYPSEIGLEGAEFGEFGEFEGAEFGEFEGGAEAGEEQFLGDILGALTGGEVGSPLTEQEEMALASELLEVTSDEELEQFLGSLLKKAASAASGFIKSPIGQALGGVLKNVAKKALPVVGGALGSFVAPGIGTAIGSKLGSMASGLFEVPLEAMPMEQAEFEVARRFVRTAATAAHRAAYAQPRPGISPHTIARAAVASAARTHAPGLYRNMIRSLRPAMARYAAGPAAAAAVGRPAYAPRPRTNGRPQYQTPAPTYAPQYRPSFGYYGAPVYADGYAEPWDGGAPQGASMSGRWVRRGRKIVVLGV